MSNSIARIQSTKPLEYQGERVVSLRMVDELHERPIGTAGRNLRRHRGKLLEGVDYFELSGDEIRRQNFPIDDRTQSVILLTQSGYLMLVKSFRDDLAWEVQRALVTHYFRSSSVPPDRMMHMVGVEIASGIRDGLDAGLKPIRDDVRELKVDVGTMKHKIDGFEHEIRSLVRRKDLSVRTKRQHIDTLLWLGGKCPCCNEVNVIDEFGNKLGEWEHWYSPHRNQPDETWLTCSECNKKLKDHSFRVSSQCHFTAYQKRRDDKHYPLL